MPGTQEAPGTHTIVTAHNTPPGANSLGAIGTLGSHSQPQCHCHSLALASLTPPLPSHLLGPPGLRPEW